MLQLSHVKGDNQPPLIEKTIGAFFDEQVQTYRNQTALIVVPQKVRWTWGELQDRVDRFAAGLLRLGMSTGDRIGIWMPNNFEWVVTQFATAKLGLILVTINPAYRTRELEHALKLSECKCLILMPEFKTSQYATMISELCPEIQQCSPQEKYPLFHSKRLPHMNYVIHNDTEPRTGMIRFEDIYVEKGTNIKDKIDRIMHNLHQNDPINLQFTSGTTGSPKAATLTHRNILNNGFFVGERQKLTPKDKVCIPVPLYHCFGLVLGNLGCVTHGSTIVYASLGFEPEAVLQAVDKEKCTILYGVPTMFVAELNHPNRRKYDLSSLRSGIMAGSPCPIEIMKQVIAEMHMTEVTIAYGMTETSPVSFQSLATTPVHLRVNTVGTVLPHLECKVVDEEGKIVPVNTPGELCTKGYAVMKGYWNQPDKTAEAIDKDGFMHSGDLVTIDETGYCRVVGRIKDMIIRGGENIYPREIEEFLFTHPSIAEVTVVGVPHSVYGEVTCAWIILKNGTKMDAHDLRHFCKGKIAHYKIPEHIFFVESFPLTVTGKIQKYIVREESIKMLASKSKL